MKILWRKTVTVVIPYPQLRQQAMQIVSCPIYSLIFYDLLQAEGAGFNQTRQGLNFEKNIFFSINFICYLTLLRGAAVTVREGDLQLLNLD